MDILYERITGVLVDTILDYLPLTDVNGLNIKLTPQLLKRRLGNRVFDLTHFPIPGFSCTYIEQDCITCYILSILDPINLNIPMAVLAVLSSELRLLILKRLTKCHQLVDILCHEITLGGKNNIKVILEMVEPDALDECTLNGLMSIAIIHHHDSIAVLLLNRLTRFDNIQFEVERMLQAIEGQCEETATLMFTHSNKNLTTTEFRELLYSGITHNMRAFVHMLLNYERMYKQEILCGGIYEDPIYTANEFMPDLAPQIINTYTMATDRHYLGHAILWRLSPEVIRFLLDNPRVRANSTSSEFHEACINAMKNKDPILNVLLEYPININYYSEYNDMSLLQFAFNYNRCTFERLVSQYGDISD